MKIAVAVATYNRNRFIDNLLCSIYQNLCMLQPDDFDISIYDDGSDIPVDVGFWNCTLNRSKVNSGSTGVAKYNAVRGLELDWDYLWVVDDEVTCAGDYLARIIKAYPKINNPGKVCGQFEARRTMSPANFIKRYENKHNFNIDNTEFIPWDNSVGGYIIHRKPWDAAGAYIDRSMWYFDDMELELRLRENGYRHYRVRMPVWDYNPDHLVKGKKDKVGGVFRSKGISKKRMADYALLAMMYPNAGRDFEFSHIDVARNKIDVEDYRCYRPYYIE